jgi:uncharacterized protein
MNQQSKNGTNKTTLILGASDKPQRYAFKAQQSLTEHGHSVVLINPKGGVINGVNCLTNLSQVDQPIDTITVYVNPSIVQSLVDDIAAIKPKRVIFNPGSESAQAQQHLQQQGIEVVEACTLVMLTLGSY